MASKYKKRKYEIDNYRRAGYEELASAIVCEAIKDYDKAICTGNKKKEYEVERFFKSQWFTELCSLDADFIMKEVKRKYGRKI